MSFGQGDGARSALSCKSDDKTPIVLMGYYNPIYQYGAEPLPGRCQSGRGRRPDRGRSPLPRRTRSSACPALERGINFMRLATPTTDDKRLPAVLANTSGFHLLRLDDRHHRHQVGAPTVEHGSARRSGAASAPIADLPVAVGFGIRTPEQAGEIAKVADAAVVGSALVDQYRFQPGRRMVGPPPVVGRRPSQARSAPRRASVAARGGINKRCITAMNWLTNYVRPKIRGPGRQQAGGAGKSLGQLPELREDDLPSGVSRPTDQVCPHCDHHFRVGPDFRFKALFDERQLAPDRAAEGPTSPTR